jgi:hypothetical protein
MARRWISLQQCRHRLLTRLVSSFSRYSERSRSSFRFLGVKLFLAVIQELPNVFEPHCQCCLVQGSLRRAVCEEYASCAARSDVATSQSCGSSVHKRCANTSECTTYALPGDRDIRLRHCGIGSANQALPEIKAAQLRARVDARAVPWQGRTNCMAARRLHLAPSEALVSRGSQRAAVRPALGARAQLSDGR